MLDITNWITGTVEVEIEFLNFLSRFHNIVIKNGKIYLDTVDEK